MIGGLCLALTSLRCMFLSMWQTPWLASSGVGFSSPRACHIRSWDDNRGQLREPGIVLSYFCGVGPHKVVDADVQIAI